MKKWYDIERNLKELIGKKFDEQDIHLAFVDFEEFKCSEDLIISKVENRTTNIGNFECKIYNVYVDFGKSTIFSIYVTKKHNIIMDIDVD